MSSYDWCQPSRSLHLQSSRMYCYGWSYRASRGMHRCNLFEIDQGSTCPIGSLSCRRMSTESASEILYRISCLDHCWPPRPPTPAYPGACLVHTIAGLGRRELSKVGQRPRKHEANAGAWRIRSWRAAV